MRESFLESKAKKPIASESLREWATRVDSFCIPVTLHEIRALLTDTPEPHPIDVYNRCRKLNIRGVDAELGFVETRKFFASLASYAQELNLAVVGIIASQTFLDLCSPPGENFPIQIVDGRQRVDTPGMNFLAKTKTGKNGSYTFLHVETDDGKNRRRERINPLLAAGWTTVMYVNVDYQFSSSEIR